mmetsp:Transcript_14113/g.47098  ORF Transcript_14113/g.47098 Transcript_14113/m.47098 type:complete len:275 (-) Transcript_14113:1357-2181(-)
MVARHAPLPVEFRVRRLPRHLVRRRRRRGPRRALLRQSGHFAERDGPHARLLPEYPDQDGGDGAEPRLRRRHREPLHYSVLPALHPRHRRGLALRQLLLRLDGGPTRAQGRPVGRHGPALRHQHHRRLHHFGRRQPDGAVLRAVQAAEFGQGFWRRLGRRRIGRRGQRVQARRLRQLPHRRHGGRRLLAGRADSEIRSCPGLLFFDDGRRVRLPRVRAHDQDRGGADPVHRALLCRACGLFRRRQVRHWQDGRHRASRVGGNPDGVLDRVARRL